ncbi:MAG: DNA gyrase inhibitor YacG [Alphaproteobacteria bacterium]
MEANDNEAPRARACPICGRPAEARHKPFCSPRCADVDLARWLTGAYVVATDEEPEAEDSVPSARDGEA